MKFRGHFLIEKDPSNRMKGLGWAYVHDYHEAKEIGMPVGETDSRTYERVPISEIEQAGINLNAWNGNIRVRGYLGKPDVFDVTFQCRRRNSSGNKFTVKRKGVKLISFIAQKSLSIKAVCAWVLSWAPNADSIVTPDGKEKSLHNPKENAASYYQVYFVVCEATSVVKIGFAKSVKKRMAQLQTANAYPLKLLGSIRVRGIEEAVCTESKLHERFKHIRLNGEWFKATEELLQYINNSTIQPRQTVKVP